MHTHHAHTHHTHVCVCVLRCCYQVARFSRGKRLEIMRAGFTGSICRPVNSVKAFVFRLFFCGQGSGLLWIPMQRGSQGNFLEEALLPTKTLSTPATMSKQHSTLSKKHSTLLPKKVTMSNEFFSKFCFFLTKSKQIEHVQFVWTLSKGRNFVRYCSQKRQHCQKNRSTSTTVLRHRCWRGQGLRVGLKCDKRPLLCLLIIRQI